MRKRFAVGALKDEKVHESFNEKVCENIESIWQPAASGAEKWEVIRDGLTDAGQEVGERIAKAARAFGALKDLVFSNSNLSYKTKRMVYKAVVLGVLLYGSETWTTKRNTTRWLEAFHNRCLGGIVGITSAQQR